MKTLVRAGIIVAGAALLSAPLSAVAETDNLDLGRDKAHPPYGDITGLRVDNAQHRVVATLRLPKVNQARLTETRLVMRQRNSPMTWRVYVSYDRKGDVTSKWVMATPEPGLPSPGKRCAKVRVGTTKHTLRTTVPRTCFPAGFAPKKPIKVRAQVTVRHPSPVPETFKWTDRTPYTTFLRRG
ncbi:hypothetical protein [Solicola gregarius]|uniref:Uncharacterized protein n=1 Tax=Solicola gregarius TaxID=2908642 RepID=A0AA46YJY7_9ACTN|nr:hypothetical protein [Solicola gregarius]UYM03478.1 hypothetical protein L0C25_13015 [Solicola gregarius]